MFVLNVLYVIYFVTSSVAVFQTAIRMKSMHDKILNIEREYGTQRNFYLNL